MANISPHITVFDLASLLPAFHEIKLPSNGKYDVDIPAVINVRGMTVKELKQITATGKLDKRSFDNIIKACIKEPLDLSRALIEDYNYIIYMIRLFSSGGKVSAATICENTRCRQQFVFEYNIEDAAEVDYAEAPIEKTKTVDLPRFKENGYNVRAEVRRLTRGDLIKVEKNIRQSVEAAAKSGLPNTVFPLTEYLKAYIVSIDGFPVPIMPEQAIDVFSSEDAELITSAFDTSFGIKGSVVTICPSCKAENHYDIPFTDIFFL